MAERKDLPPFLSGSSSTPGSLVMDTDLEDRHIQEKGSSKLGAVHGFSPTNSGPSGMVSASSHDYDLQQSNMALLRAELKLMSHDRDLLSKDLKRITTERDRAYKQLAMASSSGPSSLDSSSGTNAGTLSRSYPVSTSDRSLSATAARDYDGLKEQCERAMHELQALRRQHNETLRKCDQAVKESEYYRNQQRVTLARLEAVVQESSALRSKYNEILAEKQRVDQQLKSLQRFQEEDRKEVAELRRQQQEAMNADKGPSETMNLYIATMQKYETIKDEYTSLRDRYADLHGSHSEAMSKLDLAKEELGRIKKQYEEVVQERNSAIRERNGLKQQCTAAIRQWDTALRERNEYKEALAKVQQQHEEAVKEINQAMAVRIKASKDMKRLTEERNAAMQEYSLVMSERDTVHKEMEKLSDDLGQATKKIKNIESKNKEVGDEKKTLAYQVETLKREISSALHDRDKALKECNDLREKFGEYTSKEEAGKDSHKSRQDYDAYREKDTANKDSSEDVCSTRELHGKLAKEKVDNLDQANQEIDRLRKQVEKLQAELQEAIQEAEVSKRRRDWAFSERDKIVLERESIRTLCDKLRRERDRAVSDLAEALRDSDDIKKQRNEASKELKELKEKMEAHLEKESRMKQLQTISHNHSRDSAIDTDMQEWETETLEIDLSGVTSDEDLGFDLSGGKDDPHYPNDGGIYVSSIIKGSAADGTLKLNDCILRVNNLDCTNMNKRVVMEAARSSTRTLNLVVRRRRVGGKCLYTTQLQLGSGQEHGLTLESGIYISKITPGSVAAKEGSLAVGDRVLSINGGRLECVGSPQEAMLVLEECGETVMLTLLKWGSPQWGAPLSSSSSGHNMTEEDRSGDRRPSPKSPKSPAKESSKQQGTRDFGLRKLIHTSAQTDHPKTPSPSSSSTAYKVVRGVEKPHQSGPWEMLREKIDIVRGRRQGGKNKQGQQGGGQTQQSASQQHIQHVLSPTSSELSSPTPFEREKDDALNELDSVINSYRPKQVGGSSKRTRRSRDREMEKNVGTWPKCRSTGPPVLVVGHAAMGTVVHSRRHKERVPLSVLWTGGGNGAPAVNANGGGGKYQQIIVPPPPPDYGMDLRGPPSYSQSQNYDVGNAAFQLYKSFDGGVVKGSVGDRLSTTSMDLSVKSGNVGKEVLEYYVKKNRSKQSQSDSESTASPVEGMSGMSVVGKVNSVGQQQQHSRIHSQVYMGSSGVHPSLVRSPLSLPHYPFTLGHPHHPHHPHPHHSQNTNQHPLAFNHTPRYSFPTPLPDSQSGESILSSPDAARDARSYCFEAPYTQTQGYHHSPSPSMELHYHNKRSSGLLSSHPHSSSSQSAYNNRTWVGRQEDVILSSSSPPYHHHYEGGTFPRKKEHQRIRIPSNQSVTSKSSAGHVSTGSIEGGVLVMAPPGGRCSERGSPMSNFHVEVLSQGRQQDGRASYNQCTWSNKPTPGQLRRVHIDKSSEPLGIQISCLETGGVFVSSVSQHSLASQVGLQVGDQLLEVCGINLRSATYDLAASVLRQCGDTITMLVQYSPDKYHELEESVSSSSSSSGSVGSVGRTRSGGSIGSGSGRSRSRSAEGRLQPPQTSQRNSQNNSQAQRHHHSRSGSPTPCNSPRPQRSSVGEDPGSEASTLRAPLDLVVAAHGTLTRHQIGQAVANLSRQGQQQSVEKSSSSPPPYEPRYALLETKKASNLGISLVGGNAVGIFIHSVQTDSPAHNAGLRTGDQILEYNGINLRRATAEEAAYELAKPADKVTILAQFNIDRYNEVKDQPGDGFYIRALFDRPLESGGGEAMQLRFRKDDILFVDNTMFNGVPGHWRAWRVDEDGLRRHWGAIPSKYKVEEELVLKRSVGDLDGSGGVHGGTGSESGGGILSGGSSRRGSTLARRSFFRRKKHQRSSSRDSKELASFSDVSINSSYSGDSAGHLLPESQEPLCSYQRVERLDYLVLRPVLIVGPLSECVADKLSQDFPGKFSRCMPQVMHCAPAILDKGMAENVFVDYRRKGNHLECTTIDAVREICEKKQHCILDVSMAAVERLHRHNIYPIVLLIKFKSTKQIREVKDTRCPGDKVSAKAAKEMYEHTLKLESEYRHVISAVIPAGVNVAYMCTQVKTAVDQEQRKTLWVPCPGSI